MANCEPCTADKHNVAAVAMCEHADHNGNYWICIHPNTLRADRRFHGERCGCDCDAMYCRPHARLHARTHNSGRTCFPNFGFTAAGPAFGAAAARLGAPDMPADERKKSEDRMAEFLAEIRPGVDVIEKAASSANLNHIVFVTTVGAQRRVTLSPSFFTQNRIASVAALAADTIARTVQRLAKGVAASVGVDLDDSRVEQALYELRNWSKDGEPPSQEALATLAKQLWTESPGTDWSKAAKRIHRRLFLLEIPSGDEAQAEWLVSSDQAELR